MNVTSDEEAGVRREAGGLLSTLDVEEWADDDRPRINTTAECTRPGRNHERRGAGVFFVLPDDIELDLDLTLSDSIRSFGNATSRRRSELTESLQLATDTSKKKYAALSALMCAFSATVCRSCYVPNVPSMVTPGNPQGFPSTEPFGFATAQGLLLGTGMVGVVVSNIVFGYMSGKIGCRKAMLIAMLGQAIFTLASYFARGSFYVYVPLCLVRGLFGSGIAIAIGYVTVLYCDEREKADAFIGLCMAMAVFGGGIGGLITLCFPGNLFLPLVAAACLNVVSLLIAYKYLLNPEGGNQTNEEEEGASTNHPDFIDVRTLLNIVAGAFADNIGSLGVIDFALTPIMYEVFSLNFLEAGVPPVMSENQYRWIVSMLAFTVIPAALAAPSIFKKFGVAQSCVVANIFTALVIMSLTLTADKMAATKGSLALFVCILFAGLPLTAISNISTSPMLDRVTPLEQKSMVQGISQAVYDTTGAVFLFVFGLIADKIGSFVVMWLCVGVSLFAALVNLPLAFDRRLGKPITSEEEESSEVPFDEETVVSLLKAGKYVPIKTQYKVNQARMTAGRPFARSCFGKYSRDFDDLAELSAADFKYMRDMNDLLLASLHASPEKKAEHVEILRLARDAELRANAKREIGAWLADYLDYNGYMTGLETGLENAQIFKGLFAKSFPPLCDGTEVSVDNIEDLLVKHDIFLNHQLKKFERSERRKRFALLGKLKRS